MECPILTWLYYSSGSSTAAAADATGATLSAVQHRHPHLSFVYTHPEALFETATQMGIKVTCTQEYCTIDVRRRQGSSARSPRRSPLPAARRRLYDVSPWIWRICTGNPLVVSTN